VIYLIYLEYLWSLARGISQVNYYNLVMAVYTLLVTSAFCTKELKKCQIYLAYSL